MASGYPSSEEQAGAFHSPDSFEHTEKHDMTPLEAGIIAGTVVAFTIFLFLVFYCRHMEQRRRAQRGRQNNQERTNESSTNTAHEMHVMGFDSNKQGQAEPPKKIRSLLQFIKK